MTVAGSSLEFMTLEAVGSWPSLQNRAWFLFYCVGLKSSYRAILCLQDISATIVPL